MTFFKSLLLSKKNPVLNISLKEKRKLWLKPFIASYLVVFIGYLCMYLIRKNFNIAQIDLTQNYGFSKTDLGIIALCFSITYGLGKLIIGYFADGKNTKNVVALLLIISSICTLGFGFSIGSSIFNFALMAFFYASNGFFQSAGGPSSFSVISKWTPRKYRGSFLGFWNISHNAGGALAAIVAIGGSNLLFNGSVAGMFIFPALICLVIGILGLFIGSDSPQAYGLGTAEEIFEEKINEDDKIVEKQKMKKWDIFTHFIIKNPFVWVICISNIFVYIIRIGIDQWSVLYGSEVLKLSRNDAVSGFVLFEVGAIIGTLLWGTISDLAKGRRALTCIVCIIGIIFTTQFYQHAETAFMFRLSLFILGFLIFGPQLLLGVSLIGFVPKNAISTADGFKGMFAYLLGDSFAKIVLAMIADNKLNFFGLKGWEGTFSIMYISMLLSIILLTYVALGEEKRIRASR